MKETLICKLDKHYIYYLSGMEYGFYILVPYNTISLLQENSKVENPKNLGPSCLYVTKRFNEYEPLFL